MKLILLLAYALVSCESATKTRLPASEWRTYKAAFQRSFKTRAEELHRIKIFMKHKNYVDKHNAKYARGEVSYRVELNRYSDWSRHEVNKILNGFNKVNRLRAEPGTTPPLPTLRATKFVPPRNLKAPENLDWREEGLVNPVMDQGCCGSCYAISALGAVEGQIYIKNKTLPFLSVQNIVDCSQSAGNEGCDGGLPSRAFDYLKNNGVDEEEEYPYEAEVGKCRFDSKKAVGKLHSYVAIESGDENALKLAVASVGPISVAVDASLTSFQLYESGIYNDPDCSATGLTHAVLLVGYGTDNSTGKDYWLIKNSWSTEWGEDGYMRMERNAGNVCGVATLGTYPVI